MPTFDINNPFGNETLLACMIRLHNEQDMSALFTKRGDKRPWCDVEAQKQSRARTIKAKREAATERALARQKKPAIAPGADIASRMLQAMQPGQWLGMGDLARMVGEPRSSRGKVVQVMLRRGWVERARNPAWIGRTLDPWEIMAGAEPEPKSLYRLTEAGLAIRLERTAPEGS